MRHGRHTREIARAAGLSARVEALAGETLALQLRLWRTGRGIAALGEQRAAADCALDDLLGAARRLHAALIMDVELIEELP